MTFNRGPLSDRTYLHPDSSSFGRGDIGFIERSFVVTGRRFRSKLLRLLNDLATGATNLSGFSRGANHALLQAYTTTFSLGALSVDPFHILTHEDTQILQHEIAVEQRFLRAFGREVDRNLWEMNPQIRSNLYLMSLRGIFELGRLNALPPGPVEWVLGDTHHCVPCIEAAMGGPYKRSRWTHLDLPVLPAIPGAGDLCLGLTRCGCTLRLKSPFGSPGETTQNRMRELLAEIVHGNSTSG